MQLYRGASGQRLDAFAVAHRFKAPAGAFAAPVAHIFSVQCHAVLIPQAIAHHGPGKFHFVAEGQIGNAVFLSSQQAVPQIFRLGVIEALLAFQQHPDGVIHHKRRMRQGTFRRVI